MIWGRAVSLVNARNIGSIRFTSRILAVGVPPKRGDTIVDVNGAFIVPGLVNAHDHLELNHYGRLKYRTRYDNATEWIDDMRPRLAGDAAIRARQRAPLTEDVSFFGREQESAFRRGIQRPLDLVARQIDVVQQNERALVS